MKPEQDDLWPEIRALERALERHAYAYGLECRGVGFAALASALVHDGWARTTPAQRPDLTRAQEAAEAVFTKYGLPTAALYGPSHRAFQHCSDHGWRRYLDSRREAYKAAALIKTARGGFACTPTELAQVFEVDRATFRAFQRKHVHEALAKRRAGAPKPWEARIARHVAQQKGA